MSLIKILLFALYFIGAAIWGFLYYKGKLNYVGEKEEERKRRVNKYGPMMIVCIVIMFIGGIWLLLAGLIEIVE